MVKQGSPKSLTGVRFLYPPHTFGFVSKKWCYNSVMKNEMLKRCVLNFFLIGIVPVLIGIIPIVGWIIMGFYIRPLIIVGYLLGDYKMFLRIDMFVTYPQGPGFIVGIIFWGVVGALCGYIASKVIKNSSAFGAAAIAILLSILIAFGLSTITAQIGKEIAEADNKVKAQFLVDHCEKINLDGYYFNKCDNNTTSVPEEYSLRFLSDEARAVGIARSLDYSMHIFALCVKDGSKILTPVSQGRICENYFGDWPKLPENWKFSEFTYDQKLKTYKLLISNIKDESDYFSVLCTEKSEYCRMKRM